MGTLEVVGMAPLSWLKPSEPVAENTTHHLYRHDPQAVCHRDEFIHRGNRRGVPPLSGRVKLRLIIPRIGIFGYTRF